TETVLYTFCSLSNCSDGAAPQAALIADKQGALYSTTVLGGSGGNRGTVFKLTPPSKGRTAWTETVLYSFKGGSDGTNPGAALIADKLGALYSTTTFGGGAGNAGNGNGTVFKLALCPEREKDHDHDGCPDFQSME
ncbi:MAG: choice-of-anchor tandem repeat GloVer-containing protein, partial [Methylocella sp.]